MRKDIIFECAFYGRTVRKMGCMYYRPANMEIEDPELFFAAFYLCQMLVSRYVSLLAAGKMQAICKNSAAIFESLEKEKIEVDAFSVNIVNYHANWTCGLSASMIPNEQKTFRFGHIGFGWIIKNKKKIELCCQLSIYGLVDTLLKVRKQDEKLKQRLIALLQSLGEARFGEELYQGNYKEYAMQLYEKIMNEKRG